MTTLDRTPDGVALKCYDCSRPFKGERWQDFCAECHAEHERTSPLHKRWCCLNCNTTFPLGKMKTGKLSADRFRCPNCDSENTHPADGDVRELPEYHGKIGTKN